MSNLSSVEKRKIEKLLEMSSGYVLDFSNRRFQEFIVESTGIDIYDDKYAYASGSKAIGDNAAIAFAIGFYQALGAGRTIEDAYRFGCVQIRLQGIPEHLTPVFIQRGKSRV